MNRPEKLNTFTIEFWRELKSAFDYLADQSKCRAIVFSANGPMFCAGIDLKDGVKDLIGIMGNETLDAARKSRGIRKLIKHCQDSFSSLEHCPKPVIAAVHSHCIGAGISLASCADIRYATNDAVFSIREVDIGIAADVGILQRIHLISGNDSWARELAFTGKDVTAQEALKFGFVSRIMDSKEDCLETAFDLARKIASKSPIAVQGTKMAMNYARSLGVEESLEWMLNWNSSQLQTTDILANVKAKMNKKSSNEDGPKFDDI